MSNWGWEGRLLYYFSGVTADSEGEASSLCAMVGPLQKSSKASKGMLEMSPQLPDTWESLCTKELAANERTYYPWNMLKTNLTSDWEWSCVTIWCILKTFYCSAIESIQTCYFLHNLRSMLNKILIFIICSNSCLLDQFIFPSKMLRATSEAMTF